MKHTKKELDELEAKRREPVDIIVKMPTKCEVSDILTAKQRKELANAGYEVIAKARA